MQTFFAGEEGTGAIAGVLSGRVNPSGRLPVSIPPRPGAQPSTYLVPPLARANDVSNIDPTAAFAFGHGLGYADFVWSDAVDGDETEIDDRRIGHRVDLASATPATETASRSCSCTCTTRSPASCARCSG